jgi:hypothetical protein
MHLSRLSIYLDRGLLVLGDTTSPSIDMPYFSIPRSVGNTIMNETPSPTLLFAYDIFSHQLEL